jgi:hypothetical protein
MSNSTDYDKFLNYLINNKETFNTFIKNYQLFIPSFYFSDPDFIPITSTPAITPISATTIPPTIPVTTIPVTTIPVTTIPVTTEPVSDINNKTITNYFKTKFYLKAYLQNITNVLNIIKLNEFDLKSIEMNEIKMKRYNFSENIFNFHLEDTGNIFFKNDRLFLDEIFKTNLITKGYTTKKFFLKSTKIIKIIGGKITKSILLKGGSGRGIRSKVLKKVGNSIINGLFKTGNFLFDKTIKTKDQLLDFLEKTKSFSSEKINEISTYSVEQITQLIEYIKTYQDNRENMLIQNFILNKNVFNKFKFPLYIAFLSDNYTGSLDNKKYYLNLFKNHQKFITNLFNNHSLIGISSFSPLFEIIEDSSKNNNSNNNSNKEKNVKNNKKIFKIIGSNNDSYNESKSKNNKFYENIPENSNLYQTYDISNILEKKIEKNNEYFKIFYDTMKNISNKKYDNLYDYIINSLLLEQNFILFITSWIEKETFKKLFRLDNVIKGDIYKNIDLFMQYYNTFKSNYNISLLSNDINSLFKPIDFDNFFKTKFPAVK